jgi:hypothetical protein
MQGSGDFLASFFQYDVLVGQYIIKLLNGIASRPFYLYTFNYYRLPGAYVLH